MRPNGRSPLSRTGLALVLLAVAALAGGCPASWTPLTQGQPPPPPPPRTVESLDDCTNRLYDLCGRLMTYYADHQRLPAQLEDLGAAADPLPADALICPVSKKPYVYDPAGVRVIGLEGRLIVYDYDACHFGLRTGILAVQLAPGQAICKVVRPRAGAIIWSDPARAEPPAPPAPKP